MILFSYIKVYLVNYFTHTFPLSSCTNAFIPNFEISFYSNIKCNCTQKSCMNFYYSSDSYFRIMDFTNILVDSNYFKNDQYANEVVDRFLKRIEGFDLLKLFKLRDVDNISCNYKRKKQTSTNKTKVNYSTIELRHYT